MAAPPAPLVLTANGHSSSATSTVALLEEEPKVPGGGAIDSLVRPLVESVIEPAQLALPGLEALVATQVEAEITSAPATQPALVAPAQAAVPAQSAAVPIETPVIVPASEPAEVRAPPVESVVVAPVTESTQVAAASAPVEAPVVALVAESTQIPVASTSIEAPVESVVVASVAEAAQVAVASTPVEAPVIAPVTESTQLPVASAPVEAPVETAAVAPVTASTQIATTSEPVETPAESVVAAQILVASAPVEAPVEPVVAAPVTASAEPVPTPPIAESNRVTATIAPAEAAVESEVVAPVTESAETTPAIPLVTPVESDLSAALKLQAEAVLDGIALQAEVDHSGILAIRESFRKPPQTSLLTAPLKLVTAPAPPDEHWRRTARPVILSRKPAEPKPALMSSGPQTSTLAGPCLPLELRTFIEDPSSAQAHTRKRAGFPTWMVSVLVATFLFLGAGSLLQYVTGNRDAKAAAPTSSLASASAPGDRHPFAKFVEVTGLRVIADQNHKSQLQYIVVNHSSAQISGMAIRIAVRSAAGSSETPPLFVVSASVPSLAPYQSKEIRTGLDAELRYSAIPDWENLRADVQVNTPPE